MCVLNIINMSDIMGYRLIFCITGKELQVIHCQGLHVENLL